MGRQPDFIGLGAQKAGTSWIYSCLYEHPQICAPIKEIHFFSRQRNWKHGYTWYERKFETCPHSLKAGEFSTSYLADSLVSQRIHRRYPNVKLIVSLRNPLDRAYSNYVNDIKAGRVQAGTEFEAALKHHPEYIEQGRYASQLQHYFRLFSREQMLIVVYEDSLTQPLQFIQGMYRFLGVDESFAPSMIHRRINVSDIPRAVWVERFLIKGSRLLQRPAFRKLWWSLKKTGIADAIRTFNTHQRGKSPETISPTWRESMYQELQTEIAELERMLERELPEWRVDVTRKRGKD